MEVSGQLHTAFALPLEKGPLLVTEQKAWQAPRPTTDALENRKITCLLYHNHYVDWANPASWSDRRLGKTA